MRYSPEPDGQAPPLKIGDLLRRHRLTAGISQGALADLLQSTQGQISSWESGERQIRLPLLLAWADALALDDARLGELVRLHPALETLQPIHEIDDARLGVLVRQPIGQLITTLASGA